MKALQKRFTILMGNFGSGKTELTVAIAKKKKQEHSNVILVDMDIVNPYFRSSSQEAFLKSEGISIIKPTFALSNVDIPALPPQMQSVFSIPDAHVVIDVGGDEIGATAVARFGPYIAPIRDDMQVLYILNPFRPLSSTIEDIQNLYHGIVSRSRLKPDFIINNANLQEFTTIDDLRESWAWVKEASKVLNTPIGFTAGMPYLEEEFSKECEFFPFEPRLKPDWLK